MSDPSQDRRDPDVVGASKPARRERLAAAGRTVPGGWPRALVGGTALWLAARLLITAVGILTQALSPGHGLLGQRRDWFFRLFLQWDSTYYEIIATHGYVDDEVSPLHAFFPGYPLAVRLVSWVLDAGGPSAETVVAALWLVSAGASLAAAVLMWKLADDRYGPRVAAAATTLLVAGPYSVFLVASYAEALFLALALGAWSSGTRGRWLLAGVLCGLATSVRPNGLMLFAALVVMYVVDRRQASRAILSPGLAAVGLGVSGAAGFALYLAARTGSLTAWTDAQALGWGRGAQWPWSTFYQTAGRVLFASTIDRRLQFGLDIVFAAILVAGVTYFVRRRWWPEATYLGLTAVALMTSFTYVSLARSTLLMFPLTLAIAATAVQPSRRAVLWTALVVGMALLVLNTRQLTLGLWAD